MSVTSNEENHSGASCQVMSIASNTFVITFNNLDMSMIQFSHDNPLAIFLQVANFINKHVLVAAGSSVEVLFVHAFDQMGLSREDIVPMAIPLIGFDGAPMVPMGTIRLKVTTTGRILLIEFVVVDASSPYNMIAGRPWIHRMGGVPSSLHQVINYVAKNGEVIEKRGDHPRAKRCFNTAFQVRVEGVKKSKLAREESQPK